MLSVPARCARTAVTVVVALLLLAGTLVGQDDDFPFGPFRMYSTRDDPDGVVRSLRVEAIDTGGTLRVVDESATGLKRAEVEGQARRLVTQPDLLAALSRAHDRLQPDELAYVEVRVVESSVRLRDSRPTGTPTTRILARWTAPP